MIGGHFKKYSDRIESSAEKLNNVKQVSMNTKTN
jgi:hypothetical protein